MDRKQFAHWLDGFAKAGQRDRRAAEFLLNNFERVISLLTVNGRTDAEERLRELRADWFTKEACHGE